MARQHRQTARFNDLVEDLLALLDEERTAKQAALEEVEKRRERTLRWAASQGYAYLEEAVG